MCVFFQMKHHNCKKWYACLLIQALYYQYTTKVNHSLLVCEKLYDDRDHKVNSLYWSFQSIISFSCFSYSKDFYKSKANVIKFSYFSKVVIFVVILPWQFFLSKSKPPLLFQIHKENKMLTNKFKRTIIFVTEVV